MVCQVSVSTQTTGHCHDELVAIQDDLEHFSQYIQCPIEKHSTAFVMIDYHSKMKEKQEEEIIERDKQIKELQNQNKQLQARLQLLSPK